MMTAVHWYLLGCASGAGLTLLMVVFAIAAIWPDLKRLRRRP